jgi:hypothetical protein
MCVPRGVQKLPFFSPAPLAEVETTQVLPWKVSFCVSRVDADHRRAAKNLREDGAAFAGEHAAFDRHRVLQHQLLRILRAVDGARDARMEHGAPRTCRRARA